MPVPFFGVYMNHKHAISNRILITSNINSYNNDDLTLLCIPGMYESVIEYDNTGWVKTIKLQHSTYNHTDESLRVKVGMMVCNLSNSKSYITIADDESHFKTDGLKSTLNLSDQIDIILARTFITSKAAHLGCDTVINIYAYYDNDIVCGINLEFSYANYSPYRI